MGLFDEIIKNNQEDQRQSRVDMSFHLQERNNKILLDLINAQEKRIEQLERIVLNKNINMEMFRKITEGARK